MRVLLGLARPTAGRAELLGHDVASDGLAARRRVGYLAGDFELYEQLTGADVLAYFARLRGDVAAGRIGELAERFDADLRRPVRELSTGNRQKIGLIQAFMGDPELLILDEPIAGLDPLVQRRFHDLLGEVRAPAGPTAAVLAHAVGGRPGRRPRRGPARRPARRRRHARAPARDRGPARGRSSSPPAGSGALPSGCRACSRSRPTAAPDRRLRGRGGRRDEGGGQVRGAATCGPRRRPRAGLPAPAARRTFRDRGGVRAQSCGCARAASRSPASG